MSTCGRTSASSSLAPLAPAAAGWLVVVVATWSGLISLSLIDQVVLLAIAVMLPLSLGGPIWPWEVAAGAALASFVLSEGGAAAVLSLPFVTVAAATFALRLLVAARAMAEVVAAGYAVVAAGALLQSRLGLQLFGVGEPIVELTAVHFAFAGTAGLTLAGAAAASVNPSRGRAPWAGPAALGLTAAAPLAVALGFVTGEAGPQIAGAVLMTFGVWLTAALQLSQARATPPSTARTLLAVSGLAVWVPMILAVVWATAQHWNVPTLSVADMARTHGLLNALGFCGCGLLGRRLAARRLPGGQEIVVL